ncbi:DNA damage-binding protein 2 isoform X2 [Ananas comosus]|uniref:DNA damage-binding protein 2 isoform X2 n=1 Tax=Ananas comosus TaxID=4615 RepID=A0A6P5GDC0_ANACO|nr:DNA damage-binding protein 2 isoform X2 [Ananas comosus]
MGPSTRDESTAPRARFVHNFRRATADSDRDISSSSSSEEEDSNDQTDGEEEEEEEEEEEVSSDDVETEEVEEAAEPSSSSLASSQWNNFSPKKKRKQQAEVRVKEEAKPPQTTRTTKKSPITISLKKVCKVCKRSGHEAGFKGAVYVDCPMKPCFLCKRPGHTTMTCPHRVAMEHGVVPGPRRNSNTFFDYIFQRQLKAKVSMMKPPFVIPNQLECGNIRFHSRRVTCLEFHPTKDGILLSGDKGQLGIWDYDKLHEKMVYESIHSCIVNNMKFNLDKDGVLYTSSSDGTVHCTDLETGISSPLMDLNPEGWNGPGTWRMLYGMDINTEKGLLLVADNFGFLYLLDARSRAGIGAPILIHKKGSKVVGLHCNPVQPDLLLSCGNDHLARMWDVRRIEADSSLVSLAHGRVVNSAYFSQHSGSKILTTSQDNRIRVWDSIFGNLESPSREIVHSHDFNRHLTPFRAEWDPKDHSETIAVIGRYISENYNGVALHPIDFIDTTTGKLLAEVMDPDITTISPVNKLHPRDNILASGSSRSLFIWKPKRETTSTEEQIKTKQREFIYGSSGKKKSSWHNNNDSDDDDDDFNFGSKERNKKARRADVKYTQTFKGKGKTIL